MTVEKHPAAGAVGIACGLVISPALAIGGVAVAEGNVAAATQAPRIFAVSAAVWLACYLLRSRRRARAGVANRERPMSTLLAAILREKSPFTETEIAAMTAEEGWRWVYRHAEQERRDRSVCVTSLTAAERRGLLRQVVAERDHNVSA